MAQRARSGSVSRRRFLQASGAVPLSVAAMGVGQSSAAATPVRHPGRRDPVFDPARPGRELLSNKYLTWVRTAMQSFVIDTEKDHIYVLQIVQAGTPLPGDEEGDEAYDRRVVRGDLTLTKMTLAGERLGYMILKFFGHGVSMALERDGDDLWFWTEIDSVPKESDGQGRGSKLTRFQFEDGALLDAEHDDTLWRRDLIPDSTQNTCNIDPVHRTLTMRYWTGDEFRLALYDLDEVKQEKSSYQPLYDIGTPEVMATNVFQGYATLGDHLYLLDGTAHNADNPPPPEGRGNAHLTRVNWRTGEVEKHELETSGLGHHRREPEGLHVAVTERGRGHGSRAQVRLYTGFATSAHESGDADRLCTIYYRDVARR